MSTFARIPLSGGKAFALVDLEDFPFLNRWTWQVNSNGYAVRHTSVKGVQHKRLMHRLIVDAPDALQVDHRNGDRLDNRRSNLRIATISENNQNKRSGPRKDGIKFKGVYKNKKGRTYSAKFRGRHLGNFSRQEDAAAAYDRAALAEYGEFARLNLG